jgi:hypothetical protein
VLPILSFLGATAQVFLMFIIPISTYIKAFTLSKMEKLFYIGILLVIVLIGSIYLILLVVHQFMKVFI